MQLSDGASFTEKLLAILLRHAALPGHFNGNSAVELFVARFPNAAMGAHANPLDELEMTDLADLLHLSRGERFANQTEASVTRLAVDRFQLRIGCDAQRRMAM